MSFKECVISVIGACGIVVIVVGFFSLVCPKKDPYHAQKAQAEIMARLNRIEEKIDKRDLQWQTPQGYFVPGNHMKVTPYLVPHDGWTNLIYITPN